MTPLYQMYVNARPASNWTDFQLACQCVEATINALSLARAGGCTITLERSTISHILPSDNPTRTLLACNILAQGDFDMAICNVRYADNQYIEIAGE